ncbi:hypothetical protein CC1G_14252 [Coprinopsis cinerea okayama7|uniref:CRAL-TRIO domain-containing protein n=1 Tax=Coprinopsis cinerea (strain Okayama-7 / 130 / ATCC MYA-4618 / FGSC 9003) TaxID=240176 RepID=D6RLQ9_COPC7|nr:hypothetical protein CC1G_14252 [Coprinopsis cinerea okayama7\|eukprot:XP_002911721.1 hypothetical protein CC1G_14252 [Coprinopsis cinerea okayama7\
MDIYEHLRTNCDKLLEAYHANLQDVEKLQETLINDILPSVTDELELAPDATDWAKEWLLDTASMFRIARRNKFIKSFTMEAIRKNLIWRLQNLWAPSPPVPMPNVHCLPPEVVDPFGRPIIIIETVPMTLEPEVVKIGILQFFETLRQHLAERFHQCKQGDTPPLQCMVLVDLRALSFQRSAIDIVSWAVREVIPRYPGMLAGVFMLNYSWTHSSLWSIVKRILPESALSRVFFPSQKEVIGYFSSSRLPQDYGGDLPPLAQLYDPLLPSDRDDASITSETTYTTDIPQTTVVEESTSPSLPWISPTSLLNPFFGYPVSTTPDRRLPSLQHGRRRKRDLFKTLALLFWSRWHSYIILTCCISVLCLLLRKHLRPSIPRLLQVIKDVRKAIGR